MEKLELFISAGDPSGEIHAARLIRELRKMHGDVRVSGIGGPAMQEQGAHLLCDQDRLAVMGLVEVVRHLGFFFALLRRIKHHLSAARPDLVVLIDFPDFNFRIARIARRAGIPVLYYISPQIWAWRRGRRRTLGRLADRMAVVFPFEVDFYSDQDLEVEFVGHPLLGELEAGMLRDEFFGSTGLDPQRPLLGLMPGSRAQELESHLEPFLGAARIVRARRPEVQFAMNLLPHTVQAIREEHRRIIRELDVHLLETGSASLIRHSTALVTKSGTTTMEAAILGTPMVIAHRINPLSYWIARRLVRVNNIGMPNLLAENPAVPELVQHEATPANLADRALELLDPSSPLRERVLEQLSEVRGKLRTDKGASRRVAEIVLEMAGKGASS